MPSIANEQYFNCYLDELQLLSNSIGLKACDLCDLLLQNTQSDSNTQTLFTAVLRACMQAWKRETLDIMLQEVSKSWQVSKFKFQNKMSASRSQQLEYFLQGSVEESSLLSLRHRLKGLCDPSTTHNKFADHEIVYGLRPRKFFFYVFEHVCCWAVRIILRCFALIQCSFNTRAVFLWQILWQSKRLV
jgi:hypothetical protein